MPVPGIRWHFWLSNLFQESSRYSLPRFLFFVLHFCTTLNNLSSAKTKIQAPSADSRKTGHILSRRWWMISSDNELRHFFRISRDLRKGVCLFRGWGGNFWFLMICIKLYTFANWFDGNCSISLIISSFNFMAKIPWLILNCTSGLFTYGSIFSV